jgi:hypothetical protein
MRSIVGVIDDGRGVVLSWHRRLIKLLIARRRSPSAGGVRACSVLSSLCRLWNTVSRTTVLLLTEVEQLRNGMSELLWDGELDAIAISYLKTSH